MTTQANKQLSIIIPCQGRIDLLSVCLQHLRRHAPSHAEIIVVDDASPEASVSRLVQAFPGVHVIRNPRRLGFCQAVNRGLAAAQGQIVALLNDDTEIQPSWAEAALAPFTRPEVAAVASLVLVWPRGDRIDSAGDLYHPAGWARKRGHGQKLHARYLQAGPVGSACACSAFYRRAQLLEIGGFPADFGAYFDDVEVGLRLRRSGYQIWYEPASRVLHHGSASYGRKPTPALLMQQSRNEELLFWRHLHWRESYRRLPEHAALLCGKAWLRWQEGQLRPFLMGRLQAWAEWPIWRRKAAPAVLPT